MSEAKLSSLTGSEPVMVPREEWVSIMKELREFRADHAKMQGRLAQILGQLTEYAAIPNPIGERAESLEEKCPVCFGFKFEVLQTETGFESKPCHFCAIAARPVESSSTVFGEDFLAKAIEHAKDNQNEKGFVSVSFFQRRFRMGYILASRLAEQLEKLGVLRHRERGTYDFVPNTEHPGSVQG